jgi:hypothetical protein
MPQKAKINIYLRKCCHGLQKAFSASFLLNVNVFKVISLILLSYFYFNAFR